jgi:hypothetical protein
LRSRCSSRPSPPSKRARREAWLATGEAQERERERRWLMLKLSARVRAHLVAAVETGHLAGRQRETAGLGEPV